MDFLLNLALFILVLTAILMISYVVRGQIEYNRGLEKLL